MTNELMKIVIVGHVDHGKSSIIGRLLADTKSLPEGKLEQVKKMCEINSKPFEYAFLLDALKDEQMQGITIDAARCFFKTKKRNYIIMDAPGHIEFLRNMVTGAARAEAALIVIDINEGIQENTKQHGYIVSMLGIKQVVVLVNKMDIINYDYDRYLSVKNEYDNFLSEIKVNPLSYIPVSAMKGDNIAVKSENTNWYNDKTLLETIDGFHKEKETFSKPFRFPVQDIYKFTEFNDTRRIISGTIQTGTIKTNDKVVFYPSLKQAKIIGIEGFNEKEITQNIGAGKSTGFILKPQIYIKPGEIMCKTNEEQVKHGTGFKANLFWLGEKSLVKNKHYLLKLGTAKVSVYLKEILNVIDATDLSTAQKNQIDKYDVGECILQTLKPVAFDTVDIIDTTSRFVIIDNYEISGAGIIIEPQIEKFEYLEEYVKSRETGWSKSKISSLKRAGKYNHKSKFIIVTGDDITRLEEISQELEIRLFNSGRNVYYLSIKNLFDGLNKKEILTRDEQIYKLGELSHILTDSGQIFISTIPELDDYEIKILEIINQPNEVIVINVGKSLFNDFPVSLHLSKSENINTIVDKINKMLYSKDFLLDYYL